MTLPPRIRLVLFAVSAGAFAGAAVLGLGAAPAGAMAPNDICTLLPALCPPPSPAPTTPAPTAPPTTKPTATTKAPATTVARATRATITTAPTRSGRAAAPGAAATVGAAGLAAPAAGPADVPALGAGSDTAVPQLASAGAPTSSAVARPPSVPSALSGLVGAAGGAQGLPNDHAEVRIALSLLVLAVAGVAMAQLPASRRSPRPQPPSAQ